MVLNGSPMLFKLLAGILLDFDAKSCWLLFIKEKYRRGEDSKSLKVATRRLSALLVQLIDSSPAAWACKVH
ncbi:hypothetical protein AMECASPLE_000326 [Ameca splendens]|uniref:Uncharacterized protein n=1 Tax=Ameca splendens TaxID=208324 RepID=A0ABV0ZUR2_9TELE